MRELNEGIFTEVTLAEVYFLSYTVYRYFQWHMMYVYVCFWLFKYTYTWYIGYGPFPVTVANKGL